MQEKKRQVLTQHTDVNGYLSNLIHEDNKMMRKKSSKGQNKKDAHFNESVNDSLTHLDITD
jgi:hypothetical protein